MTLNEVAPPGFGHTKGDKKKGVEKGGTAAAFDKARKEGRFKGSKSDMFAIMWSQKNKGDKPHYKPGTDKKYKKYQEESTMPNVDSKDRKVIKARAKNLFKKDLRGDHQGVNELFDIDSKAHKAAQKKTKMRNLAKGNTNPNEKAAAEKKAGGPKLVGETVKDPTKKKPKAPQFNAAKELVTNAPYMKPALQQREGVSYKDFTKTAQVAMDRIKKAKEEKLKKNAESARKDRVEKGVRFYDKKGKGYIKKGKKVYT